MRVEFKEFKIGELFEPYLPRNKKLDKKERGRYPLICGSGFNNGVDGYTDEEIDVYENELTMSTRGSSGATFYQEGKFVLNNNSMVLKLKEEYPKNKGALLYISTHLNKLPYGGYSNYPTKSGIVKDFIKLPVTLTGDIDWEYMENYMQSIEEESKHIINLLNKVTLEEGRDITLDTHSISVFKLTDIFEYKRGKRIKKSDRKQGDTPLITAGKVNYGVSEYIKEHTEYQEEECITVDMFGNSFYREGNFFYDDNIIVFESDRLNKYHLMYIVGVLKYLTEEYSYGRQFRVKEIDNVGLILPVTETGDIDWEYMEEFMKYQEDMAKMKLELLGLVVEGK